MRKVTFYCDRCGKKVDGLKYQLAVYWTSEEDLNLDPWELETGADLCADCYKEIDDMVVFMVNNPTIHFAGGKPIEAEPEKPKRATKKKTLDLGKMAALRNAGWSYRKIADELGCSDVTVAAHMEEAQAFLAKQNVKEDLAEALENDIQEV